MAPTKDLGVLERRARYAPWDVVETFEDGVVRLRVVRSQLGPVPTAS